MVTSGLSLPSFFFRFSFFLCFAAWCFALAFVVAVFFGACYVLEYHSLSGYAADEVVSFAHVLPCGFFNMSFCWIFAGGAVVR